MTDFETNGLLTVPCYESTELHELRISKRSFSPAQGVVRELAWTAVTGLAVAAAKKPKA